MIKGIVFDLDDTLYAQILPFSLAVEQVFPAFPQHKRRELFLLFRLYSEQGYQKALEGGERERQNYTIQRIRQSIFQLQGETIDEGTALLFEKTFTFQLDHIALDPKLQAALSKLQSTFSLGIISNGFTQRQKRKLEILKVNKWFPDNQIIISEEVQVEKPQQQIFQHMEKQLELSPAELLYIGDNFEKDVVGAKNAGWAVWWFNHMRREVPKEFKQYTADKEISDFDQLAEGLCREFA